MKRILFPTDFSDAAKNALAFAVALAKASGASLDMLHTYRIPMDYHIPADLIASMDKEEHEIVDALLARVVEQYFEAHPQDKGKVNIDTFAEQGFSSDVIINFAKKHQHDLIVMGTKGASGLAEVFLGSMTANVMERSKCPVLAIPQKAKFEGVANMVYASDFSPKDVDSIHQLATFAKFFDAKVHCVHVSDDENYFIDDVSFDLMKEQYQRQFPKDDLDFKVLLGKDLENGLEEAIGGHKADIVAMTTRKKGFLESLLSRSHTKKMLYRSKVPVLAFHE